MGTSVVAAKGRKFRVRALAGSAIVAVGMLATASGLFSPDKASATIGEAFVAVPDMADSMSDPNHKNWLRIEAHYWMSHDTGMYMGGAAAAQAQGAAGARAQGAAGAQAQGQGGSRLRQARLSFTGPSAPAPGSGPQKLAIAVDKHSPALARMMANCASKVVMPEMKFAESSERARPVTELGPVPAGTPAYYEYSLKDVQIVDCPVVADAPEQALVMTVKDIQWLNYTGSAATRPIQVQPPVLTPIKLSGATKTFVVSWFADANDVSDDQCEKINWKPTEDEYYALMSKEDADKERAARAAKGTGVTYTTEMEERGPHKLNVARLPGIVKAQPHYDPVTKIARGLDLDGNDGTGPTPAGVCKHKNYLSEDGRKGIDNQLYTAQGCSGMRGHKGFFWQYANEQRRNGTNHMMVQISGIDNDRNDDLVYVTFLFTNDVMAKNADGTKILADYTYRLNTNPEYTYFTTRLKGKIVNGVITTDRVKEFRMHTGLGAELVMNEAGLRLQIMPDGSLKGIVAGYQDWRRLMASLSTSVVELNYGFNIPTMYAALRQDADGMKDPTSGICYGISSAWDIEGSAAFIPPAQAKTLVADAVPQSRAPVRRAH